jgi:hypothetical protein
MSLDTSKREKGKQGSSGWLRRFRMLQTYIQMFVDVGWLSKNLGLVLTTKWAATTTFARVEEEA